MAVPEYVARLRAAVGHAPLWLTGATAVVVRDDHVLLVCRADNGAWTPVTGITDPGEHPATTAVRETAEETTVTCEVVSLAAVGVTPTITYPNGDVAQYLDHTFVCRYLAGEAKVGDDESSDVAWWPIDALPDLSKRMRRRLDAALGHDGTTALITDDDV